MLHAIRWLVAALAVNLPSCTAAPVSIQPQTSPAAEHDVPAPVPAPAPASPSLNAPTIAAGARHTCAVRDDGTVWCWGDSRRGRLGVASTDERVLRPARVDGLVDVVEIGADYDYTCVRDRAGTVWCWGENDDGELATGDTERRVRATKVVGINAKRLAVGFDHACAITTSEQTWCWGSARFADGGQLHRRPPTEMPSLAGATALALADDHDCAIVRGAAWCWGLNNSGQIGDGRGGCVRGPSPSCSKCLPEEVCDESPAPAQVGGLARPTAIAASNRTSCALDAEGALSCWGRGSSHRRGDASSDDAHTPRKVAAVGALRAIELDGGHGCGLANDGALWCWGQNVFGEVGVDEDAHDVLPRRVVIPGGTPLEVSLGLSTSCARTAEALWCWGSNSEGQLGDGTTENRRTPVRVAF